MPHTFRPADHVELERLAAQLSYIVDGPLHAPDVIVETAGGVFALTVTDQIHAAWRATFDTTEPEPERPAPAEPITPAVPKRRRKSTKTDGGA